MKRPSPRDSRRAAEILLAVALAVLSAVLLAPLFEDVSSFGTHDWDSMAAYRYITVESIKRYHEGPWWHPWLCGGFAAWGYAEGAPNFISPLLPIYLIFPIQVALKLEVVITALVGLVGSYLFASRFTKSIALRGLVVALFMYNGRWALQASVGHGWHLQYAYMPLALFFFDRSFERGRIREAIASGAIIALMVYGGGIYPVPHTAMAMALYAAATAVATKTWRPLASLCVAGGVAGGLGAPKMLPILDLMKRFPRKVESPEAYDFKQIWLMMTEPTQPPALGNLGYGWHEFGIYVGWAGAVIVTFALLFGRGPKVLPLRVVGIVFFALGLGAFLPYAPWTLLHEVSPFSSQHVPSRFAYTALLFLSTAFVASLRWVERRVVLRPAIDLLLLVPVIALAAQLVDVGHASTAHMFYMQAPAVKREAQFRQASRPPAEYQPADAWAGASLLSMFANTGFMGCYSVPERGDPKGAIASDDAGYRGEAYVLEGSGEAKIVSWTPSTAVIEVTHATPGAVLVYNMNYEPSWNANGSPAIEYRHAVASRLDSPTQVVKFSYYPRTLNGALSIFLMTCFACFGARPALAWWRARAARRARGSAKADPDALAGAGE